MVKLVKISSLSIYFLRTRSKATAKWAELPVFLLLVYNSKSTVLLEAHNLCFVV